MHEIEDVLCLLCCRCRCRRHRCRNAAVVAIVVVVSLKFLTKRKVFFQLSPQSK